MPVWDWTARRFGEKISRLLLGRFGASLPSRLRFDLLYLGSPPWDTGVTPPELAAFIQQHPAGRAIDLGCGTGTNLIALGRAGWQVTGVDFSARAVRQARQKLARAGLAGEVRAGDVARLDVVAGKYDLALDIGCYHGLPPPGREAYRRKLPEILAPGGHFLIYLHWQVPGRNGHTGVTARDTVGFEAILAPVDRQDSLDRWERPVSWLLFRSR
jgi:SAM-dependent methyltransferase